MKKGWEIKRLPEIAEYFIGLTYSPKDVGSEGTIVLRSSNVQNDELDLSDLVRVTCSVKKPLHVRKGDILMCSRNGSKRLVGKTAVIGDLPEEMTFGTFMTVIRSELNPYLSWFFRSEAFRDQIGVGENTMINQITKYMLDVISVPVPPLAEQQRIVGLLDEAFEGLATARANAEKNLQNARALFESHLQSVFTQRGPGWVEKRLEDVCGLQNGFAFKSSTFKPSGAPILRISNIQDGRIEAGNRLVFFDPKDYRENLDRYRIVEDDLLIAMSGATTGKLGFNTEDTVYYLNQRVGKFEPSEKLNKRFLYHFLSTKVEENLRISAGAAQPNLSTEQIKGFVLPMPSVDEQERIVEALEALSEETQRLARLYEQKLAALEALKKSLLHQAFTGELQ
jgi:type I restriction enzyme S subunit